jgi:hypothetical protein
MKVVILGLRFSRPVSNAQDRFSGLSNVSVNNAVAIVRKDPFSGKANHFMFTQSAKCTCVSHINKQFSHEAIDEL